MATKWLDRDILHPYFTGHPWLQKVLKPKYFIFARLPFFINVQLTATDKNKYKYLP
jgi:hypothetical protein